MDHPVEQGIERDLPDDEPSVTSPTIDVVGVPFAELIVWAAVDRVAEVVTSRIKGVFVQGLEIEIGLVEQLGIGLLEQLDQLGDHVVIAPFDRPGPAHKEGDRADPLMGIRLDAALVVEHRDRPMSQKVIELRDRVGDDPLTFVPGGSLGQDRLAGPSRKKRIQKQVFRLMEQQIPMMPQVGRKDFVEDQPEHPLDLLRGAQCGRNPFRRLQF
jgi:hypothetical protein